LGPWTEQILPYLAGNTNVLRSRTAPSADLPGTFSPGYFLGTRPAMAAGHGFGAVNLLRMEAPSQTVLAGVIGSALMFQPGDWDKDDYTQSPAFDGNRRSRLTNPVAILFADGHVRECAVFDTNSMTVEYEKGKWYGF
jgi:prepilin-type processing-associated H-X9-DG protein